MGAVEISAILVILVILAFSLISAILVISAVLADLVILPILVISLILALRAASPNLSSRPKRPGFSLALAF
jgi:hypothetical protein